MAEIVEFNRNILMRGNYDCIQDLSTDNFSGRYVRESDYASMNRRWQAVSDELRERDKQLIALLERHRRLKSALIEIFAKSPKDSSYLSQKALMEDDEAALAEEVL